MDITWYGHSCFRVTERGQISVITDPYSDDLGLPPLRLKGDVVTISHNDLAHNYVDGVKGVTYTLTSPGEYEIGGTFVTGIAMHQVNEDGVFDNVAYVIQHGDLTVLHLGSLTAVPNQSTIEALGAVNVVLVPVGGGRSLRAGLASEVVALIEPNYIVPMVYALPGLVLDLDPVDKFLKEMGVSKTQEEDILKVSSSTLPEQPQVIVLRPQV